MEEFLKIWEFEVNAFGGGNGEQQMYVDSTNLLHLEENILFLIAERAETNIQGTIRPFRSVRLRTKRRFDIPAGSTVEFNAAIPTVTGPFGLRSGCSPPKRMRPGQETER